MTEGRVLRLIHTMMKADCLVDGKRLPNDRGTPQGGVISLILSNILLTPFDWEMRYRGYRVKRFADNWMTTCRARREAEHVLRVVTNILTSLITAKIF